MAKQESRQPGRPPRAEEPQSARLYLRAVESEKNLFEAAASAAKISLSDWIRDRLVKAANRELKRNK